jgi:hypothetical protein
MEQPLRIDGEQVTPPRSGAVSTSPDILVTRVGLRMADDLGYDNWAQAGIRLAQVIDSSCWCLGDWLVYGKRHFPDTYERAINAAGLKYQTLRNYAWIARRFPQERRRDGLTFQHHAEVASLQEEAQERLLREAEESSWTTKQLRSRVGELFGDTLDADESPRAAIPRISVDRSRLAGWLRAAQCVGVEFEHWVINALDLAAEQAAGKSGPNFRASKPHPATRTSFQAAQAFSGERSGAPDIDTNATAAVVVGTGS